MQADISKYNRKIKFHKYHKFYNKHKNNIITYEREDKRYDL
jgi:hypothetical protein